MITGVFDLRYDLFDSFSQCLPWADGSRIFAATPWPYGAYRWVRLRAARFFEETTGPPAWCGRACSSCRVRMAHPLRSSAGTSTWRAGRRSIDTPQSCHWSAQQFGGRAPSSRDTHSGPLRPKRSGGVQRGQSPLGGFLVTFCPYKKSPGTGARSPGPSTKMADIRKKGPLTRKTSKKGPLWNQSSNSWPKNWTKPKTT